MITSYNLIPLCSRPRLLVPDTNILFDSLESMKDLANSGDWSIRVPTAVVIELGVWSRLV